MQQNEQLAEELHKPTIRRFRKINVNLMEENVIQTNDGIKINVDVSVKT